MGLQLHHRKLMSEICLLICHGKISGGSCSTICLTNPQYPYYSSPTPPPPPQVPSSFYLDESEDQRNHHKISTYLILSLALLAVVFFVVCCRVIYTKLSSRRRRRVQLSSSPPDQTEETRDDFLDEEHGPMVDHPIWYIRTPGLHQSVIKAITVCRYKKGEGLIEGTECSVCLSEFQEDESLRLLPKCRHAFHLPCIDTWLNSHTNCPLCRAPIVTNPATARIPSLDSIVVVDSSSLENETSGGLENAATDSELRNRTEEEEEGEVTEAVSIRPRRSVSVDGTLVANTNPAPATVLSVESKGNSNRVLAGVRVDEPTVSKVTGNENLATTSNSKGSSSFRSTRYLQGVLPSPMKRSRSYNGKYLLSWYSRSQKKPNAILRSF